MGYDANKVKRLSKMHNVRGLLKRWIANMIGKRGQLPRKHWAVLAVRGR